MEDLYLGTGINLVTLGMALDDKYGSNPLEVHVGVGDVPGTTGGTGTGGLQTRVEYATANFTSTSSGTNPYSIDTDTTFVI